MWKSITKVWGTNTKQTNNSKQDFILTDSSERDPTPEGNTIKLWPHQEAMLHRIREIEKSGYICKTVHSSASSDRYMDKSNIPQSHDVCLGIMNDPPGSGKTFAILTHILTDTTKNASIIVVPQNIYGQWRQAIEIIFKNSLNTCKFSTSYADIMDIYGNPNKVNTYKIILLLDSFAEAYLKVLNDNKIAVCRIIVDEIDIMDKFVCSSVETNYVWLMSASYTNQKVLGPYRIGDHTNIICKCDEEFVKKSLNLPEPDLQMIECDDDHIQMYKEILDEKQLNALNTGDHQIINRIMNISGQVLLESYKDTARIFSEYLLKKSELLEEVEQEFEKFKITDDISQKEYNILMDKLNHLRKLRNQSKTLLLRLYSTPDMNTIMNKETYLKNTIIDTITNSKESKWLIFNDNGNVLFKYEAFLKENNIKCLMLDGGNQKLIEKTLKDYKEGDVQVLLLNSMIEGAGMNLENTTHLLFMHKTEEKFIEQVMGRAQRYGRISPLNVIMLFNKHE
jgi:hypothetical protein